MKIKMVILGLAVSGLLGLANAKELPMAKERAKLNIENMELLKK